MANEECTCSAKDMPFGRCCKAGRPTLADETAVKKALNQYSDANVSIGKYGEVFRHDGRTEQIQ